MRKRVAGGLALVGALALGCSACGGSPQATTSRHGQHAGGKHRTRTTHGHHPTTTTSSSTTTAPAVTGCTFAELSVTPGRYGAGLGHEGGAILFKNVGTTACTLTGYPGVAGLSSSGKQVTQAQRTRFGYLGGFRTTSGPLPVVHLQPGATASAFVEGTDVPHGTETSCPSYPALLVTPPTSATSVKITEGLPGCTAIQVHPVVPGNTGDAS
ncbi:MAG: DUF4232 domain-containing protein [Acidimicrobiales bacterium]